MTPNIQMHGAQNNILLANEYTEQQDTYDLAMSKEIAEALNQQYPGHLWAVRVQGEYGVASIHNLMLSGEWGYRLLLDKNYSVSDLRASAIKAGGEILERFNVKRGRLNDDHMATMATDFAGRVLGDKSK